MNALVILVIAGFGYLLGSIPFGLILSRMAGLGDIRGIGSGSIGATNVLRTGRKDVAALTLALDAAKGVVAVLVAAAFAGNSAALIAGVAAVMGHCTSVWLRGRGGKGVATGLGVVMAIAWPVGVACCAIWLATAKLTQRSSASSLLAFATAPVLMAFWLSVYPAVAVAAIAIVIYVRHHTNIRRLLAGTEPRIGQGR